MPKNHGNVKVSPERMAAAHHLIDWIGHSFQDAEITASERTRAAAACFAIAQEHHEAIVKLTEHLMFTSAFALGRVVFDAYVRGAWLAMCASESKVTKFFHDARDPDRMDDMIAALQQHPEFSSGALKTLKDSTWDALCDYAHTGGRQVHRWNTTEAIEANYTIEEVLELLDFAEVVSMMSVASLSLLIDNSALYDVARWKLNELITAVGKDTKPP